MFALDFIMLFFCPFMFSTHLAGDERIVCFACFVHDCRLILLVFV